MKDIQYVVETDTGQSMTDLFESFDEEPLGAASLAQVGCPWMVNINSDASLLQCDSERFCLNNRIFCYRQQSLRITNLLPTDWLS